MKKFNVDKAIYKLVCIALVVAAAFRIADLVLLYLLKGTEYQYLTKPLKEDYRSTGKLFEYIITGAIGYLTKGAVEKAKNTIKKDNKKNDKIQEKDDLNC